MAEEGFERKLTAILSADVEGYSRLMGEDEDATIKTLTSYRELMTTLIQKHRGRVVDSPGDNLLAEFTSVVDAVRCAVEIQEELRVRNAELPENKRMQFRIGINLGDVVQEEERIYGDGINIAARVEGLAEGGGICISGTVYDSIKNKLSLSYESLGEHTVKNITEPVRVYRMRVGPEAVVHPKPHPWRKAAMAALVVLIVAAGAFTIWNFYFRPDVEPASVEKMAFPLPGKPSIAVLPFVNMSEDPKQEYFSDGITEEIITALSKVPQLFVIARNSTFSYKGKAVKVNQIAEELGVRYVLEGSVRKAGDRIRITAQLIDALTGNHVWAERYDRDLKDIFALQDEITKKIITELQVKLTKGEEARVWAKGTDNLEAYIKFLQGGEYIRRFNKESNALGRKMIEEVIALDPDYARAYVSLGSTHMFDMWLKSSKSPRQSLARAIELTQKAIAMDDSLAIAHANLGFLFTLKRQHDKGIAQCERAIALDPNSDEAHARLGIALRFAGRYGESIPMYEKAIRLNPFPHSSYLYGLGLSYLFTGRCEEAIAACKKAVHGRPNDMLAHIPLTVAYSMCGREEEARTTATEILRIDPKFSVEHFAKILKFKNQADKERYIGALRKAGLPDKPPLPLPDKPSIAVLPFTNMSDDPKQEYFSDGITEEIITALSKTPKLFVIARTSSFRYKGKEIDVRTVGRELGVRYVVEGSVRRAGDKVRITAQLIDAKTNKHLWAERYDRDLKDIFALQDEITIKIIGALQVKLTMGEQARFQAKGTDNLEAYLKELQAGAYSMRFNKDDNILSRKMAEEAIALDPKFPAPYITLGYTHIMEAIFGWSESPKRSIGQAFKLAQKALSLDDTYAPAHRLLGAIYLIKGQHETAIAEIKRAIAFVPNGSNFHAILSRALRYAGKHEESLQAIKKAIRLNPLPQSWYFSFLALSYLMTGRYEDAVRESKKAILQEPNSDIAHLVLAASYSLAGNEQEAHETAAELLRIDPKFSFERYAKSVKYKNQADKERFLDALRKAGLK